MKTIAALILASLLAVMGYGIFWLVCLNYTTSQMRGAVKEALQADMTYGTPQWVPDPTQVTMELPAAKIVMPEGPVREIAASSLVLESSFLMRDRWTMKLPQHIDVTLANGKKLMLETGNGKVMWVRDGNLLTMRADSAKLLDLSGNQLADLSDIMLERRMSGAGVRLNLASRPKMAGGEGVLSGQLVLPTPAFAAVVNLLGDGVLPSAGEMLKAIVTSMAKHGGTMEIDNVSFKAPADGGNGAVFGKVQVLADGRMTGNIAVTGDSAARVFGWVQKSGVMQPRTNNETLGVARFSAGLVKNKGTVRMENMQSTLYLNGHPVGPLPNSLQTVGHLWP